MKQVSQADALTIYITEYGPGVPGKLPLFWFSVPSRPIFAFAGIWRPVGSGAVFAFLTCDPNPLVAEIHPKAMPVVLDETDYDRWLTFDYDQGYHAILDREQLGYPTLVFVIISLKRQSEAKLKAFEKYVTALPEVHECYMLNGEVDFLLKVVTRSTDAFRTFQAKKLKPLSNVGSIRVALSYNDSKRLRGVPIGPSGSTPGKAD